MQAELCVLDDDERIALLHMLIVSKTDFLDKTWHTGIDRCDVTVYLCIIGIGHVAAMKEMTETPADGSQEKEDNHYIIYSLDDFLVHCFNYFIVSKFLQPRISCDSRHRRC